MAEFLDKVSWKYDSNIWDKENERFTIFQEFMTTSSETISMLMIRVRPAREDVTKNTNIEKDIALLREKNHELKEEIEQFASEAKTTQTKYNNLKTDKQFLLKSLKDTHEALLLAKSFFKKELDIYFTIETITDQDCIVFFQFFTPKKTEKSEYYVRFTRNTRTGKNELLEMSPRLPKFEQLRQKLLDTNDMPGFLCCVRKSFLTIKQNK